MARDKQKNWAAHLGIAASKRGAMTRIKTEQLGVHERFRRE